MIEVTAEVDGQDCTAVLVHYEAPEPHHIRCGAGFGFGDAIEGHAGEVQFYLTVNDQPAAWLEDLMTDAEIDTIEAALIAAVEAAHAEARIP